MKARKLLLTALCLIGATAGIVGYSACKPEEDPSGHEHNFSVQWAYNKDNLDAGHWHKCEVEGCTQVSGTAAHTWDNGTTTKTATCFAEGEITYKCTVCEATKTQTVEKVSHNYSTVWSKDGDNHWYACTNNGCTEKKESAVHTWNNGEVTKDASCFEEGVTTYTCTVCGQTKTEAIKMIDHTFSTEWSKDGAGHWYACTVEGCNGKDAEVPHTWNNGETTKEASCFEEGVTTYTCNVCKQTKTEAINMIDHTYSTEWSKGANGHWHDCTVEGCTAKDTVIPHTFGDWVNDSRYCSACKFAEAREHKHVFATEWSKDGENHWYACTIAGCKEKDKTAPHTWNSGEITKDASCFEEGVTAYECTVCGQTKNEAIKMIDHTFSTEWSKDGDGHWHECTVVGCNGKETSVSHTFGEWQTEEDWLSDTRTCSACSYVETREHVHSYSEEWSSGADGHWHACTEEGCPLTTESIAHTKVWHSGEGQHWYTCETCSYESEKADHTYNEDKLCECDVPTAGLVYTITGNAASLSGRGDADDTLPLVVIASYVKDVDGVAVPCSAGDEGAVPVTSIGKDVFVSFDMEEVYVPSTVKILRSGAFFNCRNLATLRTSAKFTRIESMVFRNAMALTEVDLSEVTWLDENAFTYSAIKNADLPNLYTLGKEAFKDCTSLKSVKIGPNLTRLAASGYFENCAGLESVEFEGDLQEIGGSTFKGCTKLKTFKYKTVKQIGNNSFANCKALESFDLTKVERLLNSSFLNAGLKSLTIPTTLTYTASSFSGNPIKTVTFSEGITSITTAVGLAALETVNLPTTVTSIGADIFKGCTALTTINCAKTKDDFISLSLADGWDTGLGNCTFVLNDGNYTLEQLFAVTFTQLTELGTVTGTADNTCEYINLDGDYLYVVYYAYTLTQPGTLTVTVNPADADTCILTSLISFRDIKETLFENPYLGMPDGDNFIPEYSQGLKAGDTVYLAACNLNYTGDFRFAISLESLPELTTGENSLTLDVAVGNTESENMYTFTVQTGGEYVFKVNSEDVVLNWSYSDVTGKYDPWNKTPVDGYYVSPKVALPAGTQLTMTIENYSPSTTNYTLIIELAPLPELTTGENSITLDVTVDSKNPATKNYSFTAASDGTYEMKWTGKIGLIVSYVDEDGNNQSVTWNPTSGNKQGDYFVATHTLTAGQQITVLVRNASKTDTDYTLIIGLAES